MDGGVLVRYRHRGAEREVRAHAAVVATPAYVTAEIVRNLPMQTRAALEAVRYGPYVVGAFLTGEAEPMPWDGLYALATPGRSFSMLFNTANVLRAGTSARAAGGSFMVYAAAGRARALADLDDAEIGARYREDLCSLFPRARGIVREVVIQRWARGLPYAAVGRARLQAPLSQPLGAIHLAGDYLGTWYTETAVQTAETAADSVREQLGRNGSSLPAEPLAVP